MDKLFDLMMAYPYISSPLLLALSGILVGIALNDIKEKTKHIRRREKSRFPIAAFCYQWLFEIQLFAFALALVIFAFTLLFGMPQK